MSAPRVAVVTGAGRGLGRAIAEDLLTRGVTVVGADRDAGPLSWLPDSATAMPVECDVSDPASVEDLVRRVTDRFGTLDVLVNNAGILTVTPSAELDDRTWEEILQVNLGGTIRLCRAAFPLLSRSAAASVVNISSITASMGFPARLAYAASKAAIESVSRTLAVEWGPLGIRVNAVAPGFFPTERAGAVHASGQADPEVRSRLTPLRRPGVLTELGSTVSWLALQATFVTGQVIVVDGGFSVSAEAAVGNTPSGRPSTG